MWLNEFIFLSVLRSQTQSAVWTGCLIFNISQILCVLPAPDFLPEWICRAAQCSLMWILSETDVATHFGNLLNTAMHLGELLALSGKTSYSQNSVRISQVICL